MKKILVAGIAAAAFCGAPALAADLPVKAPAPAFYNWTGFYGGLNAGYGWADPTVIGPINPSDVDLGIGQTSFPYHHSGFIGGVQAGYNWQAGRNWLVGLETDFDGANIRGNTNTPVSLLITSTPGGFAGTFAASSKTDWLGTTRARIGFLPSDRLLIYATGGLAYGHIQYAGSVSSNFPGALSFGGPICAGNSVCWQGSSSKISTGWTVGGGLELAVWNNVSFKVEYLYVDLAGALVTFAPTPTTTAGNPIFKFNDMVYNIVRLGFNVKY
jgi:outer membrane immunogenic protein